MGKARKSAVALLVLAAMFCLYSAFSFHALQDISAAGQLPRLTYDRNFYLIACGLSMATAYALYLWPRNPKDGNLSK
jgi:hypothetical protein